MKTENTKQECVKSEDASGTICYYCFHNEKHPIDWKYWKEKKHDPICACLQCRRTTNEDDFKYMREEIDRQGNLIISLLQQQRDLNHDIRRVAKEIGFDIDD